MEGRIVNLLYNLIQERKNDFREDSYTCSLFKKGKDEILKKIGEECIEVILASKSKRKERIIYEMSDLLYHSFVLMVDEEITLDDIYVELERRYKGK